ncbi:MAG: branched-chain amino acid ABC transporter permease [Rhodocyclales bacterium]|nr:branched-chain amino acid ABC transporter permease [Rhodocyclales bacterium]
MLNKLLSGDFPRSRALTALLLFVFVGLALAPFLVSGARPLNVAATICVFIVLVASYDLLLGYTGIVSFAHTMFYGIGAYGAGLALYEMGPSWWAILVGTLAALAVSLVLAFVIGLFSLRVKAIFYACLGALIATLAGVLMALWLRYVGPKTMLSFEVMTDILLMVVIGGMGTLYGAVIGAAIFILAQNYLQALMGQASAALAGLPLLPQLFHPDRWLLWLGVLFVLSVYFFPTGIVGRLRARAGRKP